MEKKLMEAGKVLTPVAAAAYVLGFLAGKPKPTAGAAKLPAALIREGGAAAKSIYVVDCGSGASRVYM